MLPIFVSCSHASAARVLVTCSTPHVLTHSHRSHEPLTLLTRLTGLTRLTHSNRSLDSLTRLTRLAPLSRLTESAWLAHERAAPLLGPARSCERRPRSGPPLLFRRQCKAPNFFRTYSFGYMHHHSAIFLFMGCLVCFLFRPLNVS